MDSDWPESDLTNDIDDVALMSSGRHFDSSTSSNCTFDVAGADCWPTDVAANSSTSLQQQLWSPEYHDPVYRVVGSFLVGIIFVVGLIGNVLVVAVVTRTRSMHTPTNWYLVSLAFADILLLVSAPLLTLVEYHLLVDEWVFGRTGCSASVFAQYLGVNVSAMSITAFTVERYIAICHPMRAQAANTVRRARRVILGLWLAGCLYCSPWLVLATTVSRQLTDGRTMSICTFTLPRSQYLVYYMADLVIFYVVPLLTACVLYGLIARTLYSVSGPTRSCSSSMRSTVDSNYAVGVRCCCCCWRGLVHLRGLARAAVDSERPKLNGTVGVRCRRSQFARQQSSISMTSTHTTNSRVQVVKMLALVVAIFASLWLPYRSYVVYNSFASERYENCWLMLFCRLAVYANSAVNPILYNAMSGKFRSAFRTQLSSCCCCCCCVCGTDPRRKHAIQLAINQAVYANARVAVDTPPTNCFVLDAPAPPATTTCRHVVMESPPPRCQATAPRDAGVASAAVRRQGNRDAGLSRDPEARGSCEQWSLLTDESEEMKRLRFYGDFETV